MKHKILFFVFLSTLVFTTCDMIMIVDPASKKTGSREISESERDELEKTGHFLKLVNLPLNTQLPNIFSVSVSNSLSAIAKLHKDNYILIFKEKDDEDNYTTCTVYLPLAYNDDKEFTETGNFYTAFSIHVDALITYVVEASDHFIVYYTDGRGQADVNDIHSAPSAGSKELTEKEKNELEKTGHYLKLVNMPLNTQAPNVFSVSVSNSSSAIAKLNKNETIYIFKESNTCTVYLPLVYNDDNVFTETGYFYTAFTIHIDALTKYTVDASDHFIVYYSDGRGEADVKNLPAPPSAGSKELTEREKDELEKIGHYLKLSNMPLNTQVPNVFSVTVSNSSAPIAKLDKNSTIYIFKESNSCTVYLPLVYNDDNVFTETGYFFTASTIHIDATTKYVVNAKDEFIVYYSDGRGQAEVNNLPSASTPEPSYLTVINLPPSVSVFNFSNVSVRNQSGSIANCKDYSQIILSSQNNKTTAQIPLHYNSLDKFFYETGVFYVLFDINVDVDTRYTLTENDQVKIPFINGNGSLDIQNIPEKPVPYLTIKGLPINATKHQVSNINVYNSTSSVASCSDINSIVFFPENNLLTFLIPLKSSSGGDFLNSGDYYVSFLFNIDVNNRIEITLSDKVLLYFTNGSAEFNINSTYGYFKASLTNPDDYTLPIIAAGSSFDVNGHRAIISGNLAVPAITPNFSCILYLYAFFADGNFYYEFSNTPPAYNNSKKGYYSNNGTGIKRALWKMFYLYSSGSSKYLFKTYIADSFPHFGKITLDNYSDFSQTINGLSAFKTINGSSNPPLETFSLDSGVYVIELKGAGGGSGAGNGGSGGQGGLIREIITLNSSASFSAFTGSSGGNAPSFSSPSGTFSIIASSNYFTYETHTSEGHTVVTDRTLVQSNTPSNCIVPFSADATMSGGGGGGGGSGTFLYNEAYKYLLAAGGGGGGSGGSYLTPGGGGGSGGSVGPGAGGGGSGAFSLSCDIGSSDWSSPGGLGGYGGGYGAGSRGSVANNGGNAAAALFSNYSSPGGSGSASYNYSALTSGINIPYLYAYEVGEEWSSLHYKITDYSSLSIRTYFYSSNSGTGGAAAALYYDGLNAWLNTDTVSGQGASSCALPSPGFSDGVLPLTLYISSASGRSGSSGGNNRDYSRGGGGSSGEAGSITIYKIF